MNQKTNPNLPQAATLERICLKSPQSEATGTSYERGGKEEGFLRGGNIAKHWFIPLVNASLCKKQEKTASESP